MKLIEKINKNLLDFQIQSIESINNNKALEQLIYAIRMTLSREEFKTKEEIDAYFKTAILLFNNLEKPYWRNGNDNKKLSDYFMSKMDITFDGESKAAINSLIDIWSDRKATNIEFNMRGLEVLLVESRNEFPKTVISLAVKTLMPLIERAEKKLVNNN
ncbi:MAG: hypothetical protein A2033_02425 [Bacteroidetes bacterium GWA2_31_9]|nr:MAG: hypothetical protein A2033_02425 [Bacteroidetes bacterium GWA2_31_9]